MEGARRGATTHHDITYHTKQAASRPGVKRHKKLKRYERHDNETKKSMIPIQNYNFEFPVTSSFASFLFCGPVKPKRYPATFLI